MQNEINDNQQHQSIAFYFMHYVKVWCCIIPVLDIDIMRKSYRYWWMRDQYIHIIIFSIGIIIIWTPFLCIKNEIIFVVAICKFLWQSCHAYIRWYRQLINKFSNILLRSFNQDDFFHCCFNHVNFYISISRDISFFVIIDPLCV